MHEHLKPGEGGRGHEQSWGTGDVVEGEKKSPNEGKKRMRKESKVEKEAILAKKKKAEERARLKDMRRTKGKGIQTGVRKKTPKSERGKKAVRGREEGE